MNIDDIIEIARLKGRVIALEAEVERLRSSSFVTAVPSEDYEKLKAELAKSEEHNAALCERLADLNAEVHTASCANANMHKENARLKAEVERLNCEASDVERFNNSQCEPNTRGYYLKLLHHSYDQSNEHYRLFVVERSKAGMAEDEIKRLKAEVERLRKAGDAMAEQIYNEGKVRGITFMSNVYEWNAAKEGKQS